MSKAYEKAIIKGKKAIKVKDLETAFREQDQEMLGQLANDIVKTFDAELMSSIPEVMFDTLIDAGERASRTAKMEGDYRTAQLVMSFDKTNPAASAWAKKESAELIIGVGVGTKRAIKEIMHQAFEQGLPPRTAARLVRAKIGLSEGQADAVMKVRKELASASDELVMMGKMRVRVPSGGLSVSRVEELTDRYSTRALNYRARTIARTETIAASNEGQRQLWEQATDQGLLTGNELREWIVTPDDRLCEICESMEGALAGITDKFETDLGELMGPPLHPNCRCAVGLTDKTDKEVKEQLEIQKGAALDPEGRFRSIPGSFEPEKVPELFGSGLGNPIMDSEDLARKTLDGFSEKIANLNASKWDVNLPYTKRLDPATIYGRWRIASVDTALNSMVESNGIMVKMGARGGKKYILEFDFLKERTVARASGRTVKVNLNSKVWVSRGTQKVAANEAMTTNWFSTGGVSQTLVHETGHLLHYGGFKKNIFGNLINKSPSWEEIINSSAGKSRSLNVSSMKSTARKVGRYAESNPNEFVAETFSGLVHGVKYNDEIMDMYKLLGGPKIKGAKISKKTAVPKAKFTQKEINVGIEEYVTEIGVNPALRKDLIDYYDKARSSRSTLKIQEIIDRLDEAFEGLSPSSGGYTLHRGIPTDFFPKNVKVGSIIEDKGFISTSASKEYAREFIEESFGKGQGTYLRIITTEGSKTLNVNKFLGTEHTMAYQKEVILPRGSKLIITRIEGDTVWTTLMKVR